MYTVLFDINQLKQNHSLLIFRHVILAIFNFILCTNHSLSSLKSAYTINKISTIIQSILLKTVFSDKKSGYMCFRSTYSLIYIQTFTDARDYDLLIFYFSADGIRFCLPCDTSRAFLVSHSF